MIRVKTCLLAEEVSIDPRTGQASALRIVQSIEAPAYPAKVPRLALLCLWERAASDPGTVRAEFSITLDAQLVHRHEVDVEFGAALQNRTTIRLEDFAPDHPGLVTLRLAMPGHETAEWTLAASESTGMTSAVQGARQVWDSGNYISATGAVERR